MRIWTAPKQKADRRVDDSVSIEPGEVFFVRERWRFGSHITYHLFNVSKMGRVCNVKTRPNIQKYSKKI